MLNTLTHAAFLGTILIISMLLSSCQKAPIAEQDASSILNQVAERYVKLGLELGQYDKDYVDAYLGPKEWADAAKSNPRTKIQLGEDIAALLLKLESLAVVDKELATRQKALFRNVRAMDVRIRMLNGELFSFAEEARLIYDAILPAYDFSQFDQALSEIDKLIPGEGDLASRVDAFRDTYVIPQEKVHAVVDMAIGECRARSAKHIALPPSEHFELEYVTDKNWSGYNWYQGNNKSVMQVNQDFPMKIDRAIGLGCHEGYPGHHVWNVLLENELLVAKGWVEFSLYPLFSPYGLIAEGSANFGVDLAFPGKENINYTRDILFPLAGLDPQKAAALDKLNVLTTRLSHASTATAQLYLDGKISREQALELIRKYSLVSPRRAEQSLRFTEQYRAYVLNYNLGKDIVASYVNKQGEDQDSRWQAFERMLTNLSTASDMQD
jgi:hypothetical protein